MSERFRFDQRVCVPQAPEGKVVIKCFGLPLVVCAALPGEPVLGSGLTESQAREAAEVIRSVGVGPLAEQKSRVSQGRVS